MNKWIQRIDNSVSNHILNVMDPVLMARLTTAWKTLSGKLEAEEGI